MAMTVKWGNAQKDVLVVTFSTNWTWNDMLEADDETNRMMETVPGQMILLLADLRQARSVPKGMSVRAISQTIHMTHPQSKALVIIVNSPIFKNLLMTVAKTVGSKSRIHFVNTVEEAEAKIIELGSRLDERLPTL